MKFILLLLYVSLFSMWSPIGIHENASDSCEAKIEYSIDKENSLIYIEAKAVNNGDERNSFRYNLKSMKIGPSGTSSTSQSGDIEAEAGDTVTLSTQNLDYRKGNKYSISLSVISKDGKKCSAEKTLSYKE